MKKPKLFLFILLCGIMPHIHGLELQQPINITGVVVDDADYPIPGATIAIQGTQQGTSSDIDGKFTLAVPNENAVLQISFIGYETQTMTVGSRRTFRIVMVETSTALEEVTVVAYSTQKKESITGAISSVKTADLKVSASPSIANSLAGRVSGLISYQGQGGQPGKDDATIYLRGAGTWNGTAPLILIDGVPRDNMRTIDPNEVESISVLKDASATAVFGVRGANGVILITTKRGNKDTKPQLSVTYTQTYTALTRERPRLHSLEYFKLRNEAYANDGIPTPFTPEIIAKFENPLAGLNPNDPNYEREAEKLNFMYPDTDYYAMFVNRWAPQSVINANLIGGTEKISYFMNIGYLTQDGLLKTEPKEKLGYDPSMYLDRYSFRANADYQASKYLKFYLNVGTYIENVNMGGAQYYPNADMNWMVRDIFNVAYTCIPISMGPYTIDGYGVEPGLVMSPSYLMSSWYLARSPFEILNYYGYATETRANLNSSMGGNLDLSFITPGLSIDVMMSFDSNSSTVEYGYFLTPNYVAFANPETDELSINMNESHTQRLSLSKGYFSRYLINAQGKILYSRIFGDHDVSAMFLGQRDYFENNNGSSLLPYNVIGMAGRVTYNYATRYFAEVNLGYNGSEQFAPSNRFGFFPAFSIGWALSNEKFLQNNPYITFLKLRGSMGRVGNDKLGADRFLYLDNITQGGGALGSISRGAGINEGRLGNPNLSWEVSTKYNAGLDFKFMKSLSGSIDVFKENRTDILISRNAVPTFQGIPLGNLPRVNMGEMENHGVEFELVYNKTFGTDFVAEARGNLSFNKNKVVFIDEVPRDETNYYTYRSTGFTLGQLWGYVIDYDQDQGYWTPEALADPNRVVYGFGEPRPGDFVYKDLTGDGIVDDRDMAPVNYGSVPRCTWGVSTSLQYKNADLYIFFNGLSKWATGISSTQGIWEYVERGTFFPYHHNAWTQERWDNGDKITYPALSTLTNVNHRMNSFFAAERSFTRLRNVEIGYTLPKNWLKVAGVSRCRFYLSGQNIFLWSPKYVFTHLDPENNDTIGYPQTRTFSFGTNITF